MLKGNCAYVYDKTKNNDRKQLHYFIDLPITTE